MYFLAYFVFIENENVSNQSQLMVRLIAVTSSILRKYQQVYPLCAASPWAAYSWLRGTDTGLED